MLSGLIIFIHVVVSIFLIVVVLLQSSKGGGLSGFLSGAAESTLGVRGATTFLHKMTVGLAIVFMISSMTLAYMNAQRFAEAEEESTVLEDVTAPVPVTADPLEMEQLPVGEGEIEFDIDPDKVLEEEGLDVELFEPEETDTEITDETAVTEADETAEEAMDEEPEDSEDEDTTEQEYNG